MITSRRDYILRLIEEVGRILANLRARGQDATHETALATVLLGFERLFALDADQIFLLTPDQHFEMLSDDEPEFARDKVLLYAALSAEAGYLYAKKGTSAMARAAFTNALRFTLRARARFSSEGLPDYAPNVAVLLAALRGAPLDAEITDLLAATATASQ